MKIVTVEQMRELERRAVDAGVPEDSLMESAGLAVARRVTQLMDGVRGKRVVVLVGGGNNGGDGLVAARYLADWGALVTLYMTSPRRREDKFEACRARRVRIVEASDDPEQLELGSSVPLSDAVLDAVLGIGGEPPLGDSLRAPFELLRSVKQAQPDLRYVALDIPTGVGADGACDDASFRADLTLTLGAPKVGLYRFPGAAYAGLVEVLGIGLPDGAGDDLPIDLADIETVSRLLPRRPLDSHKGTFGSLLLLAGSRRFIGAPVLAASAAYRTGRRTRDARRAGDRLTARRAARPRTGPSAAARDARGSRGGERRGRRRECARGCRGGRHRARPRQRRERPTRAPDRVAVRLRPDAPRRPRR